MSAESANQFVEEAKQAFLSQSYDRSLELANQAIDLDPNLAEAFLIRALSLSNLGQPQAASESFQMAKQLDPYNPKPYYNYSVHLYQLGEKNLALAEVRQAISRDPNYASAKEFEAKLELELGIRTESETVTAATTSGEAIPPPQFYSNQAAYSGQDIGSVPFVQNMGKKWDYIGWGIAIASILYLIISVVMVAGQFTSLIENPDAMMEMMFTGNYVVISLLGYGIMFAMLGWAILDILNRRTSWAWLILIVVLGCCCGMGFVALPIYLVATRK
ncbi:MAG: tetratricopeptide repeat protein [Fimbriimonadaceae bacterium]